MYEYPDRDNDIQVGYDQTALRSVQEKCTVYDTSIADILQLLSSKDYNSIN